MAAPRLALSLLVIAIAAIALTEGKLHTAMDVLHTVYHFILVIK